MAITAAKLQVEVDADTRGFQQGMDKADREVDGFVTNTGRAGGAAEGMGSSFANVAKYAIAGVGVAGLKRFATASFNAAADLNESMNAVQVVFGNSADTILDFSDTAIDSVGLAEVKVNQAATVLGSSLQAAGLEADQAADQTINLTKRAADMASVFNTDVDTALQAIQAAIRGEIDPIEKFGVSMNAASVEAYALSEGLHDGTGEMDNQTKVLARLGVIMDQTERVQGDYENTQDSAANATKRFNERLTEMQAEIGQKLIPVVEELLPQLEELIPLVTDFAKITVDVAKGLRSIPGFKEIFEAPGAIASLKDMGGGLSEVEETSRAASRSVQDRYVQSLNHMAQTSNDQATPAVRFLAEGMNTARLDADGMKRALDRLIGREIDAAQATLQFESDLAQLIEELQEGARTFDVKTEAGRANQKQLLATISTTRDMIEASVNEARTVGEARDAVAGHIDQLRESMRQGGLTEQQISDLIDQYNLVPDRILTQLQMTTNAYAVFEDVRAMGRRLRAEGFNVTSTGGFTERAHGGPVMRDRTYLVGEQGPELFTASQSGYIVPNHQLAAAGGGGDVNISIGIAGDPKQVADEIAEMLRRREQGMR